MRRAIPWLLCMVLVLGTRVVHAQSADVVPDAAPDSPGAPSDGATPAEDVTEPETMMDQCRAQLLDPAATVLDPMCEAWCEGPAPPDECQDPCDHGRTDHAWCAEDWRSPTIPPALTSFAPQLRAGVEGNLAVQIHDHPAGTVDVTLVVGARVLPTLNLVFRGTAGLGVGAAWGTSGADVVTSTRVEAGLESLSYVDHERRLAVLVGGTTGIWLPTYCHTAPCAFAFPYVSGQVGLVILDIVGEPPPDPNDGYAGLLVGVTGGLGYSIDHQELLGWVGPTVGVILTTR